MPPPAVPGPQWLAAAVESAVSARSPRLGRAAHCAILRSLSPSVPSFLCNHLVNMYSKLDLPLPAAAVLSLHPDPSVVSWTALIAGLVQNGRFSAALAQFALMLRASVFPNDFTFPCAFKAAAALTLPPAGRQLHALALKSGLISDVFVACSALDMYCKTGLKTDAATCSMKCPRRTSSPGTRFPRPPPPPECYPNSITLCAFLNACAGAGGSGGDGYLPAGEQLHGFIVRSGFEGDVSVGNALIDFYGKLRRPAAARRVFDGISPRNDVSWCSMIAAYAQNAVETEAFAVFLAARREGMRASDFMLSSVLTTCAGLAGVDLGRALHAAAVRSRSDSSVFVGTALVDMYGKCGSVADAERAFQWLPSKNLVSWNAMIGSYAQQGLARPALEALHAMALPGGTAPNHVTLVCAMAACSRGGSSRRGSSSSRPWGEIRHSPHLGALRLRGGPAGARGREEAAYELIRKMPMAPSASVWGHCWGPAGCTGRWSWGRRRRSGCWSSTQETPAIWEEMKVAGVKKGPGCSWVSWRHEVHGREIRTELGRLEREMRAAGYSPETRWALYDVEEEEKEGEVREHSEKLAVAFGLLWVPAPAPIRVTKNLRREIILRDNVRFHHFSEGRCSCGDYW
ncbi:unnamed protein product [Spirodela intermedia]|uniref:DYW domain-containing protein n=1 Tax=Spirodela intermedia TaxID=51605 RepID=A0A7I8IKY9_SPIIN|nr:unnamed protein product [Spirodela intermedia]CAA6658551.1 unnamed protein product [Spirodela intermedia]